MHRLTPGIKLSRSSYKELNRRIKQGDLLNRIARESNLRSPIEQVLRAITPDLQQTVPFKCFDLLRFENGSLTSCGISSSCQAPILRFYDTIINAITLKQKIAASSHCANCSDMISHTIIPVVRNDKVYGALFICYEQPTRSPREERFLEQLADQIAVTLENLQLYQEVLQAELEKQSLVGELAAGAAHEIRNPLTSIRGFVQIMQGQNSLETVTSEYFSIILSEIDRIEQIVRELLLLAKPHKHKWVRGSITQVLKNLTVLIESQAHLKDIVLDLSLDPDLPDIYVDPDQLKQVFLNIIQNAIDAMPNGGQLSINVQHSYSFITVEIKDTGEGIPPENISLIFHPFFTTKETTKGTGLGLSISSRIIQSFGGTIKVKSQVGQGTTFTVRIPHA